MWVDKMIITTNCTAIADDIHDRVREDFIAEINEKQNKICAGIIVTLVYNDPTHFE